MDKSYYDYAKQIDNLLEEHEISREVFNALLKIIYDDEDLEGYYFHKVRSVSWFLYLKRAEYFAPSRIKFDADGNALFWNILNYLERISEQVTQNSKCGKDLIEIIESVIQFLIKRREEKDQSFNNCYIWWHCAKILFNLPNDTIRNNLPIDDVMNDGEIRYGFKTWLDEWMTSQQGNLILSEVGDKLLGKFLGDSAMLLYAGAIIDIITRIKIGSKKSSFTRKRDAVLVGDKYWIMKSFKKYSREIGEKLPTNIIYNLADKLNLVLKQKRQDYLVDIKVSRDVFQLYVSRIKQDGLAKDEVGFKNEQYSLALKQYSSGQLAKIDLEDNLLGLHGINPKNEIKEFTVEASDKGSFISIVKIELPVEVNWDVAEKLDKKLEYLFEGLSEDYSQVWCKSLADGPEHNSNAEDVLILILRDILLVRCEVQPNEGKSVLKKFLSIQYRFPVFKKLVLAGIDKYWDMYSDLFFTFLKTAPNVLEDADWEVELYDILRKHNNNTEFNRFIETIKQLIDSVPEYYRDKGEEASAYWKHKWLSPLKDNPSFSGLYQDAKKKAKLKEDRLYEPQRSAFYGGFVGHKSPLTKEKILDMPNAELVKYFKDFQGAELSEAIFSGKPDREGLCDAIQAAAKEKPTRFINDMIVFVQDGLYRCVNSILGGLRDAWNEGKDFSKDNLIKFCKAYTDRSNFKSEALKEQGEDGSGGKYIWVAESIVALIECGSKKDDPKSFKEKHFLGVEQVFKNIFPYLQGESQPDTQRDAVNYALNTTLGRVMMGFLSFSLHKARINQQKEKDWGKNKYEPFFAKGIEAYIWFGRYLPNLRYLDEVWTDNKIKEFSSCSFDNCQWQMFMEAYLTGPYVYKDIYERMRNSYTKAIENKVFQEMVDHRLVEHITIGYLREYENLNTNWNLAGEKSLFEKLLYESFAPEKRDRWPEVVSFLWSITGKREEKKKEKELSEEFIKKMLNFWRWTFDHREELKQKLEDVYLTLLCNLAELTIVLDKIDEEKERWLMLSAPNVDRHHFSSFFIEYLTLFHDKDSIKRIGRIFLKVLEHTTPAFKSEDIIIIVQRLFEGDEEDQGNARAICNTYGRRGIHFLKDLFYKYQ